MVKFLSETESRVRENCNEKLQPGVTVLQFMVMTV